MNIPDAARNANSFGDAQGCCSRLKATRLLPEGVEFAGSFGCGDKDFDAVGVDKYVIRELRSAESAVKS